MTLLMSQDQLEKACAQFHDFLRERYKQCLCSVFPTAKQWRAIDKQQSKTLYSSVAVTLYITLMFYSQETYSWSY